MSNYAQLISLINNNAQSAAKEDEGKSLITKTLEVADQITSEAYGRTVQAIGDTYEAAKLNVQATPQLFKVGRERARERTAAVLIKLLSK